MSRTACLSASLGLFAFLLLSACGLSVDKRPEAATLAQSDFALLLDHHGRSSIDLFSTMVVIPNVGCGGCITRGEGYFVEHVGDPNYLFIFTMIPDIKLFKQSYIWQYAEQANVIIDSGNMMPAMGFYSDRPCFIEPSDGLRLAITPM